MQRGKSAHILFLISFFIFIIELKRQPDNQQQLTDIRVLLLVSVCKRHLEVLVKVNSVHLYICTYCVNELKRTSTSEEASSVFSHLSKSEIMEELE